MYMKLLIEKTAKETELSQAKVREVIRTFFKYLSEQFKDAKPKENLVIPGYGTFKVVKRKARKARNLQTGKEIRIPPKKVLIFKPGRAFIQEFTD